MKTIQFALLLMVSFVATAQNWETSYENALARAVKTNRPLIVVFSGSDWCAPCIKLEKEVWVSEEFKSYATENYVLYRADFPRKKKNQLSAEQKALNAELADRFNPKGHFPLVVILNSKEHVLGKTSYKKTTPNEYISHLNSFIE